MEISLLSYILIISVKSTLPLIRIENIVIEMDIYIQMYYAFLSEHFLQNHEPLF